MLGSSPNIIPLTEQLIQIANWLLKSLLKKKQALLKGLAGCKV